MAGDDSIRDMEERDKAKKQQTEGLYQALSLYCASDAYPYHMPGHKRNPMSGEMADFYRIDITEIDGFDNLHHAQGILKQAQERANRLYGAQETYYLVNGSTCGVLAAIMSVTQPGEEILMARNCHKAVYHAVIMQGLKPHYYYPGFIREYGIYDGIDSEKIGSLLDEYPACKAVVVTSPTYEGIVSDIQAVARVVHERGKVLIVDEAHGAHFCLFDRELRSNAVCEGSLHPFDISLGGAVAAGADLVIHSLHKTLPAMTQTALLHVNGSLVDRDRLRRYLTMLQSSSPSYVLMASMDSCVRFLEEHGQERIVYFQAQYDKFCQKTAHCKHIHVGKMTDVSQKGYYLTAWDTGKLVISVQDTVMSGPQLYDILREEYHLQMEMAANTFVLAMMTVMDTEESWQRLADAICKIDDRIEKEVCAGIAERREDIAVCRCDSVSGVRIGMTPAQAFHSVREEISLQDAAGRVAADFINLYPPGVPLVVPGEILEKDMVKRIGESLKMGLNVQGVSESDRISVVRKAGCR